MIKMLKDYYKATGIIVRSYNYIFKRMEDMAPHLHVISDERKEKFTQEIGDIMANELVNTMFSTGLNIQLANPSILRKLRGKLAIRCYKATNTLREEQIGKGIERMQASNLHAKSIQSALEILKEAHLRGEAELDKVLKDFEDGLAVHNWKI